MKTYRVTDELGNTADVQANDEDKAILEFRAMVKINIGGKKPGIKSVEIVKEQ